jgi:hypothetical protein
MSKGSGAGFRPWIEDFTKQASNRFHKLFTIPVTRGSIAFFGEAAGERIHTRIQPFRLHLPV